MITKSTRQLSALILLFSVFGIATGCQTSSTSSPTSKQARFYQEGYPEISATSIGWITSNDTEVLRVFVDVGLASLIKVQSNPADRFITFIIDVTARAKADSLDPMTQTFTISMSKEEFNSFAPLSYYSWSIDFDVPPSEYTVDVAVTDQASNKTARVRNSTTVHPAKSSQPRLTGLIIKGHDSSLRSSNILNERNIPSFYDSLTTEFQILGPDPKPNDHLLIRLIRFQSDLDPARLMFYQTPYPGSLPYEGINFDKQFLEFKQQYPLEGLSIPRTFTRSIRHGDNEANYRLLVDYVRGDSVIAKTHRDFAIRSSYFPEVRTARSLLEPLYYLMDDEKYQTALNLKSSDSIKAAVDQFWTQQMSSEEAAPTLKRFYERVEQANRYFTSFKEGWKTDMGMIYILYGPPYYVDQRFDQYFWSYGFYQNPDYYDPQDVFVFKQTRTGRRLNSPHYLLKRQDYYYQNYQQMRSQWLIGNINQN